MKTDFECERAAREIPPSTPLARHGRRATVADRGSRAWPPLSATHATVKEEESPSTLEAARPEPPMLLGARWEASLDDAEQRILFCTSPDPELVVHFFDDGERRSVCGEERRGLGFCHRDDNARRCGACLVVLSEANRTDDSLNESGITARKQRRGRRLPHGSPHRGTP